VRTDTAGPSPCGDDGIYPHPTPRLASCQARLCEGRRAGVENPARSPPPRAADTDPPACRT